MKILWSGFRGENRALHPMLLPDTVGVTATNQNPVRGDFRPFNAPLTVATVPASRSTIYRMGRDVASDNSYWLSWPGVVHAVRGFVADDVTERTYYSGDGFPKWTDNTLALSGTPYPTAWRQLGVPPPATAPLLVASGGVSALSEIRFYVYTYVTDKGEEGAPSPLSLQLTCKPDDVVAISALAAAPAGNYGINRIRVYRTQATSGGDAEFFFLREIASSLTSTTDDNRSMGEVMPSTTWLMPPQDLRSLTGMWNGMMAGITGNAVRFCEAYKPYAWPQAYEVVTVNCAPVALAKFGQALLVLTTGRPILVSGGSPESMDEQPLEIAEACVSVRSVVSFGHGVVWACPDGLAYYGAGGPKMLTAGLMTRADWQAIKPETIVAASYEGSYMGFYTVAGVTKGFLIDPLNPTGLYFNDVAASAVFFDEFQDALYLLNGVNVQKWDAGTAMTANARSKQFRVGGETSFGWGLVVADNYPCTFRLYVDSALKHTQTVANGRPFRLPSGLGERFQLDITSTGSVQGVGIAHSNDELEAQ